MNENNWLSTMKQYGGNEHSMVQWKPNLAAAMSCSLFTSRKHLHRLHSRNLHIQVHDRSSQTTQVMYNNKDPVEKLWSPILCTCTSGNKYHNSRFFTIKIFSYANYKWNFPHCPEKNILVHYLQKENLTRACVSVFWLSYNYFLLKNVTQLLSSLFI